MKSQTFIGPTGIYTILSDPHNRQSLEKRKLINWWSRIRKVLPTSNKRFFLEYLISKIYETSKKIIKHKFAPNLKVRTIFGFTYPGNDNVFRFIIEYSSLRDFGP